LKKGLAILKRIRKIEFWLQNGINWCPLHSDGLVVVVAVVAVVVVGGAAPSIFRSSTSFWRGNQVDGSPRRPT